jgi:hypothetical protein
MDKVMVPVKLSELRPTTKRLRGLVWCSAKVRAGGSTWDTNWKWCIGVYCPREFADGIANPWAWFVPGISDGGVQVIEIRIEAFCELPADMEIPIG